MKILAIDYGRKRIGASLFQVDELFTLPAIVLSSKFEAKEKVIQLLEEYSPDVVVLGNPPTGPIRKDIEKLSEMLLRQGVKVHLLDEGLTTVQAEHEMYLENVSAKDRKGLVDSMSAKSLLQAFIEKEQISS
ncbi:Holliday junction resolvase RuvX [candidate division WWE3 bacterium]|uniref:Putative pre-16S rRNA nuclease n=1 Tax=candidate division WWE3 bacterium TaxID=2053526 RepID=A0A955LUZ8_UNCKA|nr:Holliday junction resolvase RuvX [candidate division WWE3 bacterium]